MPKVFICPKMGQKCQNDTICVLWSKHKNQDRLIPCTKVEDNDYSKLNYTGICQKFLLVQNWSCQLKFTKMKPKIPFLSFYKPEIYFFFYFLHEFRDNHEISKVPYIKFGRKFNFLSNQQKQDHISSKICSDENLFLTVRQIGNSIFGLVYHL